MDTRQLRHLYVGETIPIDGTQLHDHPDGSAMNMRLLVPRGERRLLAVTETWRPTGSWVEGRVVGDTPGDIWSWDPRWLVWDDAPTGPEPEVAPDDGWEF